MSEDRKPTNLGARRCSEWLQECKRIGWASESMPRLCDLFWAHHNDNGELIEDFHQTTAATDHGEQ